MKTSGDRMAGLIDDENGLGKVIERKPDRPDKVRRYGLYLATVLSVLVAAASVRFLFMELAQAAPGLSAHAGGWKVGFYLHVTGATVALLVGPFQFFAALRAAFPMVHRSIGVTYVIACLFGGSAGIYIGYHTPHGPIAAIGYMSLGTLWLASTGMGLMNILKGKIADHRRWMVRSFALAFAAVTLRLYLPPMFAYGVSPVMIFSIVAWLSWLPNLYVAERYIVKR